MNHTSILADRIQSRLPEVRVGTLKFWGEWFGRPHDNQHRMTACEAEGNELLLHFNEGEVLRVWSPDEVVMDGRTFRILDADRVRWEWFSYGHQKTAKNLYFYDFIKENGSCAASTNVTWYAPNLRPSLNHPAVEIV